jgi:hypothetical protein
MSRNLPRIGTIPVVPGPNDPARRRCAECDEPLAIRFGGKIVYVMTGGCLLSFDCDGTWSYKGYGAFCTQTCATVFANREYDRGRRKNDRYIA